MKIINQDQLEKMKLFLHIGAIFIALILPYFYVIGLAYYDGEMSASGLSASIFPISTADIYVKSFFAVLSVTTDALRSAVFFFGLDETHWKQTLGFSLLLFGVVAGLDRFEKSKLNAKLKSMQSPTNEGGTATTILLTTACGFLFLSVLILFLTWGIVLSAKSGASSTKKEINSYIKEGCFFDKDTHWNSCIKLVDKRGNILHEGLLIAKTESEIAIFEKNQSLVLKLDQEVMAVRARN